MHFVLRWRANSSGARHPAWGLVRCCALSLLLWGATACRTHPQLEGRYASEALEVIEDECLLLSGRTALWQGELVLTGDTMAMEYELFDIRLVGRYLDGVERFVLDGSLETIWMTVQSRQCLVDRLTVHLEAETLTPSIFEGVLRLGLESRDGCACVMSTKVRSTRL